MVVGIGNAYSNSLRRFKDQLENSVYFRSKGYEDNPPVEVEVEVPLVWKKDLPGEEKNISFGEERIRCRRLDTGDEVWFHFCALKPLTAMEVIAWASK